MTGRVESLAWDTEFFGFPIGKVSLNGATPEILRAIDDEARDLGIECLYGMLDPDDADATYLIQTFGHRLVEIGISWHRRKGPLVPRPGPITVRTGTVEDLPRLKAAIAPVAPWSRFAVDPRFGDDAALRMFYAWVERAAADGEERLLLIAEDGDEVVGMSTNVRTPVPRVDLMGVVTISSGAAWVLMAGLNDWADGGPIEAGPCAARNIPPLKMLATSGFIPVRTQYVFHRWLDEGTGRDGDR